MPRIDDLSRLFAAVATGDVDQARELASAIADAEERVGKPGAAATLRKALVRRNGAVLDPGVMSRTISGDSPFASLPASSLDQVRLRAGVRQTLQQVAQEFRSRALLIEHGVQPRNRLFFHGPPGCGKTATARALGGELDLPVFVVRFDALLGSLLGETASRLHQVFRFASLTPCIMLIDEIDAIGRRRGHAADVAELDRVVITLMQLLDLVPPAGLIVAASNLPDELDPALLRRFDERLEFPAPDRRMLLRFARKIASDRGVKMQNGVVGLLANAKTYDDAERVILAAQRRALMGKR